MFFLKKIYCRIFQAVFRAALPLLPYREPVKLNAMSELDGVFKKEHIKRLMVVTDRGIRDSGILTLLEDILKQAQTDYVVYDKTSANPTVKNVEEAFEIYRENGCESLIAIGGGSSMDCAKAIGARVAYPKKELYKLKGNLRVLRKIPIVIAVPTTAGTGSETTLTAVITDTDRKHKYVMNDFVLIPKYAVLDAKVTYTLPKSLTASTGMDALTHAVEAYIGGSTTKETREKALQAVGLIFENIEKAYNDGFCEEARANMLKASYLAGIAFSKSYVGYIHAIAHSLGGQYNFPHGLANAVIMPYVLEAYGENAYKKLHKLAVYVGISTEEKPPKESAEKFIRAIKDLNRRLELPHTVDVIKKEDIPVMAKHAAKEANPLYPVPKLMDQKALEKLYFKIGEII